MKEFLKYFTYVHLNLSFYLNALSTIILHLEITVFFLHIECSYILI